MHELNAQKRNVKKLVCVIQTFTHLLVPGDVFDVVAGSDGIVVVIVVVGAVFVGAFVVSTQFSVKNVYILHTLSNQYKMFLAISSKGTPFCWLQ